MSEFLWIFFPPLKIQQLKERDSKTDLVVPKDTAASLTSPRPPLGLINVLKAESITVTQQSVRQERKGAEMENLSKDKRLTAQTRQECE